MRDLTNISESELTEYLNDYIKNEYEYDYDYADVFENEIYYHLYNGKVVMVKVVVETEDE